MYRGVPTRVSHSLRHVFLQLACRRIVASTHSLVLVADPLPLFALMLTCGYWSRQFNSTRSVSSILPCRRVERKAERRKVRMKKFLSVRRFSFFSKQKWDAKMHIHETRTKMFLRFYLTRMQYAVYGRNKFLFSSFRLRTQNEISQQLDSAIIFAGSHSFFFDVMRCPTKKNIM